MTFIYRSYADAARDVREWSRRLPADIMAVCGIPRSGTIVAAMLAEWRGIHLVEFTDLAGGLRPWERPLRRHVAPKAGGCVLVVDDTCWSGRTMREVRPHLEHLPTPLKFAALYAGDKGMPHVDFYGRRVGVMQHTFEWNVGQDCLVRHACLDMDGVLCEDYPHRWEEGPTGEATYREFLANVKPLRLPRYPVLAIVTGRLERWRPETEAWLLRHGVRYGELRMNPAQSVRERATTHRPDIVKANYYASRSAARLFIESDHSQAVTIAGCTGKPTFSIERMEMLNGSKPDPFPPLEARA